MTRERLEAMQRGRQRLIEITKPSPESRFSEIVQRLAEIDAERGKHWQAMIGDYGCADFYDERVRLTEKR